MVRFALSLLATAVAVSAAAAAPRPVVVELFTSQGCSSCPPADVLLTDLAASRPDVLALAFHVTYWDRLGWRDPYGLKASTERQARYGARFGDGSYTPEMVVDGKRSLVGSDRSAAAAAIAEAERNQAGSPEIAVERKAGGLAIRIGSGHGSANVLVVGFDPQHRTAVGRGENSGRTLVESDVVRSIRVIGRWSGMPTTVDAALPAGERAAVLLQEENGAIVGASRLR